MSRTLKRTLDMSLGHTLAHCTVVRGTEQKVLFFLYCLRGLFHPQMQTLRPRVPATKACWRCHESTTHLRRSFSSSQCSG
eukprot:4320676-Pyramimonas_sp.AAC.1